jgi:hypothetical protein
MKNRSESYGFFVDSRPAKIGDNKKQIVLTNKCNCSRILCVELLFYGEIFLLRGT